MSESLVVYAGSKYGKAKKRLVEKAAKTLNLSTSEFIWGAIRTILDPESKAQLAKIEEKENA